MRLPFELERELNQRILEILAGTRGPKDDRTPDQITFRLLEEAAEDCAKEFIRRLEDNGWIDAFEFLEVDSPFNLTEHASEEEADEFFALVTDFTCRATQAAV